MASIGFAQLWTTQEEASAPFSFQRGESSTSIGTKMRQETEEVRQRRTAVLCSNYYYYYFPLCRRRNIIQKQRIISDLGSINPIDANTKAQFPNLPLLLTLTQTDWQPNFGWAIKDAAELPFLFHLPTPSVAYDFLSTAIAFAAVMPQVSTEKNAEDALADLFGNSTYLTSPPGSAQRQRIKNDYRDWQKIAESLFLDQLYSTCYEESCTLWNVASSQIRLEDSDLNPDSDPLLVRFWLWLMSGWQTCFSFNVPYNPHTAPPQNDTRGGIDNEFVLVHAVAQFLVRSAYNITLSIELDSGSASTLAKVCFSEAHNSLSLPAPAIVQEPR
jgi:hypothetical protein